MDWPFPLLIGKLAEGDKNKNPFEPIFWDRLKEAPDKTLPALHDALVFTGISSLDYKYSNRLFNVSCDTTYTRISASNIWNDWEVKYNGGEKSSKNYFEPTATSYQENWLPRYELKCTRMKVKDNKCFDNWRGFVFVARLIAQVGSEYVRFLKIAKLF